MKYIICAPGNHHVDPVTKTASKPSIEPNAKQGGYILITALVTCVVIAIVIVTLAGALISNARYNKLEERSSRALHVAEAGIDYYRWHLIHNPDDYKDGGTTPSTAPFGPYVHNYYDSRGTLIGTYTLTITPPTNGTTIATIKSVGKAIGLPGDRTVVAKIGQPSLADNLFTSNTSMIFSTTSTTNGPVFSNGCIEFNGTNNGTVTSAQSSCGSHGGVWGSGGPSELWSWPAVARDFAAVTADLNTLQTLSNNGGVNLGASGKLGWYLYLKSNGTIDVYKVTKETSSGITKTFVGNQVTPNNGVVFSPEEVWVSGDGYPGRVTIVAAKLPDSSSTRKSINIIDDLTLVNHSGTASVGLIAQQDVFMPRYVPNDMTVEAGMVSQYGSVGFDTNNGGGKSSFTLYGAIAQNQNDYGFKVNGCNGGGVCKGFLNTYYTYDQSMLFGPPPHFPTSDLFSIISWREQ